MALRDRWLAQLRKRISAGPGIGTDARGRSRGRSEATAHLVFQPLIQLSLFAALATLHTWPLATDPAHLTRLDNDDTAFNTWVVAWVAHQVVSDPLNLFQAPIFHPAPDALAFSEHIFVPTMMGAPLLWAGMSPVLVYNVLVWLGLALSGFAMCVVIHRWTGSSVAGIVAGCLYAFNAHLLTRYPHLQALHMQFFPFVLYAFDRVLSGGRARHAVLLCVTFLLQSLCSNYTMVLMSCALLVALAVRPELWRAGSRRIWITLVLVGATAALLLLPFVIPYYRAQTQQGMVRPIEDVRHYSAGWTDYLATAGRVHFDLWAHRFLRSPTALFPGVTAIGLGLLAILTGLAGRDRRARMVLAFGLVGFALSFGANLPGYELLHAHVPLLQGVRAVGRWGFLLLIALAVLSGFAVAWLETRWKTRPWWPAVALALIGLVTLEALRAPLSFVRYEGIPAAHSRLATDSVSGIVVFPLYGGSQFNQNAHYMLDQTRHWKPMINAYSSWAPESFYRRATLLQSFPSEAALADLRSIGVNHAVLHRQPLDKNFGAAAVDALRNHPALEFLFEEDGIIVYRIK